MPIGPEPSAASGQGAGFMAISGDDPDDFWSNIEERHAQHRRHLIRLMIISLVFVVAGIVIAPALFWLLVLIGLVAVVEVFMLRATRPRSKLPRFTP